MKKFNLAIEKGRRYFENELVDFYFIATEFIFKKEDIISGNYRFEFKNADNIFFQQSLNINVESKKVIVEKSHEDPLIESDTHFFICGQLTSDLIQDFHEIDCLFFYENQLLEKQHLNAIELKELFLLEKWNSEVSFYNIKTKKDCIIRVHLGKSDSSYYEEQYQLNKNELFNFKNYLKNYEYVAVQCSYELGFDLEEKHIFKGIKGIYNSSYYIDGEEYIPLLPFSKLYTKTECKDWIQIDNYNSLISYYKQNFDNVSHTFEMDEQFLIPYYKKYKTSAIGKIYSKHNPKKYHIDSNFCKQCDTRSECIQLVPSGLSEIVFKKNLMVENFQNCSINKLIKSKE